MSPSAVHLDLDGAWGEAIPAGLSRIDLSSWGPRLRYSGPRAEVEAFDRALPADLPPYILYGSGDFHYLSGLLVRRHARASSEPALTLVSFDNHPDWDVRPPHWGCGGWINRALALPGVSRASVWGCGNFELSFPSRFFANHRALRSGRLQVHAWAERQPASVQRRFDCMTRQDWRTRFERFADSIAGNRVYVTVDMDCLRGEESVTNWENGLFTAEDVAWAIRRLRSSCRLVAGDVCGAWSSPAYSRWRQRFAAIFDHPRLATVDPARARQANRAALDHLWPALSGA